MKPFVSVVFLPALLAGCAAKPAGDLALAQNPTMAVLGVGVVAPEFALRDQTGRERTLAELRKNGTVAIVFYRSARW